MIEKIRHGGSTAFVEHDPVTGNPLFLRDIDKKSVHMYISDPVDSDIRLVKDDRATSTYKEFDPYGARDEKVTVVPRDVFDPFRYRFGLVDRGGTGRYLFGVRFYDPNQGVWTQQDSLDAPLDPNNANRYAYAAGDPVNNFDPTGLLKVEMGACGILCFSGGFNYDEETEKLNIDVSVGASAGADGHLWIGESTSTPGTFDASLGVSGKGGFGVGGGGNIGCSLIGNGCYAEGGGGGVLGISGGAFLGFSFPIN